MDLEEKIESGRRRIWQLRYDMARKREELRRLRGRLDDMDNAFMHIVRQQLKSKRQVAIVPIDQVEERFRELQAARDEYYAAQSAYEDMERELENEELELEKLEVDLSRLPQATVKVRREVPFARNVLPAGSGRAFEIRGTEPPSSQGSSSPPSPVSLLGISGERDEDIHPLYEELLDAAGHRRLIEEHCEDLDMHYEEIMYDLEIELHRQRVRNNQGNLISEEHLKSLKSSLAEAATDPANFEARFGVRINEHDLEFLREYKANSRQAREKLDAATRTLDHLRNLCIKKGVMRKHASYHEELAIFSSCPDWAPPPQDGNMAIDPPPPPPPPSSATSPSYPSSPAEPPSLAHPRFPILLSNPSHVLALQTPLQALQQALRLPKHGPAGARRRAECMKELGISTLMTRVDGTADYINQWLIHRLRTSPLEAELMLAVAESVFKVVNLRRWQEEVLYYWRLDDAARAGADERGGTGYGSHGGGDDSYGEGSRVVGSGGDEEEEEGCCDDDVDDVASYGYKVNSVASDGVRARSDGACGGAELLASEVAPRSVKSMV